MPSVKRFGHSLDLLGAGVEVVSPFLVCEEFADFVVSGGFVIDLTCPLCT